MTSTRLGLLWLATVLAIVALCSAAGAGSAVVTPPELEIPTAPVELDGQTLFRVRGAASFPAAQRATAIRGRIEAVARDRSFPAAALRLVEDEHYLSIMAGDRRVMGVLDGDTRTEQLNRKDLALAYRERIRAAIEDYRHARRPEVLLKSALQAGVATVLVVALVVAAIWLARRFDTLIARRVRGHIHSVGIQSFEILREEHIWSTLRAALGGLRVLAILVIVFFYLHFVLGRFPWTRGTANHLLDFVVAPVQVMGLALVANLPNLAFLTILFLAVRFAVRLVRLFFDAVATGSVNLPRFEAAWAGPTYKVARLAIVLFALVVAYPYIPGSESDAFKGISIFLGVVLSLGSSSIISNALAGYALIYRRAFKVGDRVKIGAVIGDVVEMRPQVTHLRSLKNEEVIVPNSVILGSEVVNYTSFASAPGLILHTSVGIGYETPWRQVEAMLLLAAERTPGLAVDPPPFVWQKALGDFAVEYELNAYCRDARLMMPLYTDLHRHILDVFNEYGVQIMTPAYEGDPEQPKLVPKDQWYASPAAPVELDGRAGRQP